MARPRKSAEPAPPFQDVHLRIPLRILEVLDGLADNKKQSRNQVMVTMLAKATSTKSMQLLAKAAKERVKKEVE